MLKKKRRCGRSKIVGKERKRAGKRLIETCLQTRDKLLKIHIFGRVKEK